MSLKSDQLEILSGVYNTIMLVFCCNYPRISVSIENAENLGSCGPELIFDLPFMTHSFIFFP